MVIVTATMWPQGNQSASYELLHASISNRTEVGDVKDSYMAHVTARPNPFAGIIGYDADVEVNGHTHQDGFAPLLMAVLGAAHRADPTVGVILPPVRQLARVELIDARAFEGILRGRK